MPENNQNGESATQNFLKMFNEISNQKILELERLVFSLLKVGSCMGLAGFSGALGSYTLHRTILAYIGYKNSTDLEKKKHAGHMKYYGTIASISIGICGYAIYAIISTLAKLNQTLPAPSAQ